VNPLTIWQAILLGVVEGVTEFLPISSTGHLIITAALLGLDTPPERKGAIDAFHIVVQGGAILAVLGLYRDRVHQMIRGVLGEDPVGWSLLRNLVVSFLPAAVLGVALSDTIEEHLFHPVPVVAALALGGIAMLLIGPWQRRTLLQGAASVNSSSNPFVELDRLTILQAFWIGLLQCVAMWPGMSRSMMTMLAGLLVGLRPRQAAEFSFLLGLPTLGAACVYKIAKDLMGPGPHMWDVLGTAPALIGILAAAISAALAVHWLVTYLGKHDFSIFGWYRILLSIFVATLIWQRMLTIAP